MTKIRPTYWLVILLGSLSLAAGYTWGRFRRPSTEIPEFSPIQASTDVLENERESVPEEKEVPAATADTAPAEIGLPAEDVESSPPNADFDRVADLVDSLANATREEIARFPWDRRVRAAFPKHLLAIPRPSHVHRSHTVRALGLRVDEHDPQASRSRNHEVEVPPAGLGALFDGNPGLAASRLHRVGLPRPHEQGVIPSRIRLMLIERRARAGRRSDELARNADSRHGNTVVETDVPREYFRVVPPEVCAIAPESDDGESRRRVPGRRRSGVRVPDLFTRRIRSRGHLRVDVRVPRITLFGTRAPPRVFRRQHPQRQNRHQQRERPDCRGSPPATHALIILWHGCRTWRAASRVFSSACGGRMR